MKYTQPSAEPLRKALEMRSYWMQQGVWPWEALESLGLEPDMGAGWDDVMEAMVRIQGG